MELLERGAYLATLGEHLGSAVAGHGRLVLVGGEAGVEKTSTRPRVHRSRPRRRGRWESTM